MGNFFDIARRLGEKGRLGEFQLDYGRVREVRDTLYNAHARSCFDVNNLEAVLNLIETASLLGESSVLASIDLKQARDGLVRLVAAVLQHTQTFALSPLPDFLADSRGNIILNPVGPTTRPRRVGPSGYDDLARLLRSLKEHDASFTCDFITFNYDLGLELALWARGWEWVYEGDATSSTKTRIFKVHGSIGWASPIDVNKVPFRDIARVFLNDDKSPTSHFDIRSAFPTESSDRTHYVPLIVPPSENKAQHRSDFVDMWRQAGNSLGRANVIAIAG